MLFKELFLWKWDNLVIVFFLKLSNIQKYQKKKKKGKRKNYFKFYCGEEIINIWWTSSQLSLW